MKWAKLLTVLAAIAMLAPQAALADRHHRVYNNLWLGQHYNQNYGYGYNNPYGYYREYPAYHGPPGSYVNDPNYWGQTLYPPNPGRPAWMGGWTGR